MRLGVFGSKARWQNTDIYMIIVGGYRDESSGQCGDFHQASLVYSLVYSKRFQPRPLTPT